MSDNLAKKRLAEHFKKDRSDPKQVFNQLSLFIYSMKDKGSDLYRMAKILSNEQLLEMISYFNKATIKVPDLETFRESLILSLVYYFYEIKKKSWNEIKEILQYDRHFQNYSLISLGKRIMKIKRNITKELARDLTAMEIRTVLDQVVGEKNEQRKPTTVNR